MRDFAETLADERRLGLHRSIAIEARLYLNGQYQTMVERQSTIQGGPDNPDLAAAVDLARSCAYSAARNVSFNAGIKGEGTYETSFVGQYCGLLVPIDRPDRQCKRLSRRCSIGRRCRAYDPPYLSRYFWRLCWWMVRAPPLRKMASRASKRQPYSICR